MIDLTRRLRLEAIASIALALLLAATDWAWKAARR